MCKLPISRKRASLAASGLQTSMCSGPSAIEGLMAGQLEVLFRMLQFVTEIRTTARRNNEEAFRSLRKEELMK